jgi:hypothetical protein
MLQVIRSSWISIRRIPCVAVLFVGVCIGACQGARPECFVDVPVYDFLGNEVPFEIIAVQSEQEASNLLTGPDENSRGVVDGTRLYFPKSWLGRGVIYLTLRPRRIAELKGERNSKRAIELNSCEQRTSLRIGVNRTNRDIHSARIEGHLSGCQLGTDWWVRVMPMFGGHDDLSIYEGFIRLPGGSFTVDGPMRGERHILIIGRGKQPLTAMGVDVTSGGGNTNVGVVDLSKMCPK